MDTKKLRQKILDLAIHGKLVPQDPNDEPASVLLERISNEKKRLIKVEKIKSSKQAASSDLSSDDVPFDLPEGWCWCRLDNVADIITGCTPSKSCQEYYENGNIPFFKPSDLDQGRHVVEATEYVSEKGKATARTIQSGAISVCCIGSIGKTGYIEKEGITNQQINTLIPYDFIDSLYIYYFCLSDYFQNSLLFESSAITISIVNKSKLGKLFIPLPPLEEQKRIVSAVEQWMSVIDVLENNEEDLRQSIDKAKSKILDLAIRGKLVPQDSNDEPASELLKRLGISPDNSPCEDLPNGWKYVNLGSLFKIVSAKRVLKSEWKSEGVPFYRTREIVQLSKNGEVDNDLFISYEHYTTLKDKYGVPKCGDIMLTAVGTIGKTFIVRDIDLFYYKDASVLCLKNKYNLLPKYFSMVLNAPLLQKQMFEKSKGTTVDTITIEKASAYIVPLPPLAEQHRIVAKIEQLYSQLDEIESSLQS